MSDAIVKNEGALAENGKGFEPPENESAKNHVASPTPTRRCGRGGWDAKWLPDEFSNITRGVFEPFSQNGAIGLVEGEDCAIQAVNDEQSAVLTLDWFPPVVDDPYSFGAIAAAASLSNLYALGASPVVGLNMMALPCKMGIKQVGEVMRGGSDKIIEAGGFVVGGHSIDSDNPMYGLATFGIAHPSEITNNANVQPGDVLFYTKPLGTGFIIEALTRGMKTERDAQDVVSAMSELNKPARIAAKDLNAHGAIGVFGYGLVGHLHKLLETCKASARIRWDEIELFDGIMDLCENDVFPERTIDNMKWAKQFVDDRAENASESNNRLNVLCDPQTSGGLIMAVAPEDADAYADAFEALTGRKPAQIGEVVKGDIGLVEII